MCAKRCRQSTGRPPNRRPEAVCSCLSPTLGLRSSASRSPILMSRRLDRDRTARDPLRETTPLPRARLRSRLWRRTPDACRRARAEWQHGLVFDRRPEEDVMESFPLLDCTGRRRSPATTPGFRTGIAPRNKGSCRRRHEPFYAHLVGMPTSGLRVSRLWRFAFQRSA